METYRLNSKLVENKKEYLIQTVNDVNLGAVSSEIYINGQITETIKFPHPEKIKPEEILSLVKSTHEEKKKEIETLLAAINQTIESHNPEMIYNLGLAFYYKKFYDEALDLFNNAVSLEKDYHQVYNYLGMTNLALGNIDVAVKTAEKAVKNRPEYADYRNNLGEAYMAVRKFKNAGYEFEKAIHINTYYDDAYFNYGLVLLLNAIEKENMEMFSNFLSKSHEYFTKASLIYPDYRTANFERGLGALKIQELKQAFSFLKQVREEKKELSRRKHAPYYLKYALYPQWISEKVVNDRITFLQKEIRKNPTYVDLHAELARCYLEQSRILWEKGIARYNKTLELNPALTIINTYVNETEKVLDNIKKIIDKITEKG